VICFATLAINEAKACSFMVTPIGGAAVDVDAKNVAEQTRKDKQSGAATNVKKKWRYR
jgi:hypothetical protein